jgi:hypothetical protein
VPQTGEKGIYLKQQLKDKLIAHNKQYIDKSVRVCRKFGIGSGAAQPDHPVTPGGSGDV